MSARKSTVVSPCLGMCDVYGDVCTGCLRDINEISDWPDMSDEKKLQLRAVLELRRKEVDALELRSRK